jgi:hypothetical protein
MYRQTKIAEEEAAAELAAQAAYQPYGYEEYEEEEEEEENEGSYASRRAPKRPREEADEVRDPLVCVIISEDSTLAWVSMQVSMHVSPLAYNRQTIRRALK